MTNHSFGSDQPKTQKLTTDVKIFVKDLQVGMFVSGLDRSWLETPFSTQGFYLFTEDDVAKIKQHCKWVYIHRPDIPPTATIDVNFESGELIGRKPHQYVVNEPIEKELESAGSVVAQVKDFAKSMLDDARLGKSLDSKSAREFVNKSVESVVRHPDAMAWMARMRGNDEYTTEHCLNVCFLSIIFGRKLGLKKNQLSNLGLCGLLHDVGKMRVANEILNKPSKLSSQEWQEMKRHVNHGKDLLEQDKHIYQGAIATAYTHHVRPDGLGYPENVCFSEIDLFTKIVAVVDAYDAITGDRVYASGRPSTDALRIIYEGAGTQFDKNLALAFIQTIGLYPPGSFVQLISGEVAVVLESANRMRHLPRVLLLLNKEKQATDREVIDLMGVMNGTLSETRLIKKTLPDGCYGLRLRDLRNSPLFKAESY